MEQQWTAFHSQQDNFVSAIFSQVSRIDSIPIQGMDIVDQSQSVQEALRSGLGRVIDPEERRLTVVGGKLSGKTHFIELMAMNARDMAHKINITPLSFLNVSETVINEINDSLPRGLNTKDHAEYFENIACNSIENICFVTDSVRSGYFLGKLFPESRVIAESDPISHETMQSSTMRLLKSSPLTWFEIDVSSLSFTNDEVCNALTQSLLPRIERDFNVNFTRKDINAFVAKALEMSSIFEETDDFEDEYSSVPIGQWYEFARDVFREIILTDRASEGRKAISEITQFLFDKEWGDNLSQYFEVEVGDSPFSGRIMTFPGGGLDEVASMLGLTPSNSHETDEDEEDDTVYKFRTIREIRRRIKRKVIGQDETIDQIVDALSVPVAGLNDPTKPLHSFLFFGPTGVGKTKTALSLSEELMTTEIPLTRLDMSEYGEKHEAAKIFGGPPGYVGYKEETNLTDAVKKHPRSIILLDEIEKAHPTIWDAFLQVFDAGRMTTPTGEVLDFSKTIIIMTSNLGADELNRKSIGFGKESSNANTSKDNLIHAKSAARKFLRTEFMGRINTMVSFSHLSEKSISGVLKQEFKILSNRSKERGYELSSLNNDILNMILAKSNTNEYGAREIQNTVHNELFTPVANCILSSKNKSGRIILKIDSTNHVKAEMEGSS